MAQRSARVLLALMSIAGLLCQWGCFDPEVRICDFYTSAECGAGESCVDSAFDRCPEAEQISPDSSKACIQPSAETCVAMGTGKAGSTCDRHTDCGPDMFCIGAQTGICRTRCNTLVGGCATGETCLDLLPPFNTPDDVGYCTPPVCDPVAQTGCKKDEACLAGPTPRCGKAGDKATGETCASTTECAPGGLCLSTTKQCVASCDTTKIAGVAAGCKAEESCAQVTSDGKPLAGNLGHCVPPCDITSDAGCPEEGTCLKVGDAPPKCYKAGTTAAGNVCFATGDCVHGAHCIQDSANFKKYCAPKCDPTNPAKTPCGSGQKCWEIKDYPIGYCGKS